MSSKRSHKKSRLGCKQCKSRKVKCDEKAPCCGNCAKRGVECEYQAWKRAAESIELMTSNNFAYKNTSSESPSESSTPSTGLKYSLDDLGLLHYFTMYTSQTVNRIGSAEHRYIWQHDVPRLAQDYDFLMHALLAFSAAHRATCEDTQPAEDLRSSRRHYGEALTLFRDSVMDVNAEKGDAFFCYAILISFLTLFLEFRIPVDGKNAINNFISFVHILQSSVNILKPVHNSVQKSKIGTLLTQMETPWSPSRQDQSTAITINADVASSLDRLADLMQMKGNNESLTNSTKNTIFTHTLAQLRRMFTLTDPCPSSWAYLLSWAVGLQPDFILLLQQRHPGALCLLAHWCVPVYNAPAKWFVVRWPDEIILAIARQLEGSGWEECMEWPLKMTVVSADGCMIP